MVDEEIRTYPLSLEETESGIMVSVPWAQRHANGAVIARVHMHSPKHSAGELLLNEGDVIALDQDERPLRTQVRRFWGYSALGDITAAHLQTARFDVGFRVDLAATGGNCGLSIAIVRSFRPGEGPKAVGGPWVFRFRVADDTEIATAMRAEAARAEASQREAAQREAAQREIAERDAAQREAARLARLRAEADRGGPPRTGRENQFAPELRRDTAEGPPRAGRSETDEYGPSAGRGRRMQRFGRPERLRSEELRREPQDDQRREPIEERRRETVEPTPEAAEDERPAQPTAPVRSRGARGATSDARRLAEAAIMGPAETALEAVGEAPPTETAPVTEAGGAPSPATRPATRTRAPRTTVRRGARATGVDRSETGEGSAEGPGGESSEAI